MRRFAFALIVGIISLAAPAFAAPVALQPAKFSPAFQTKLERTLGVREGAYLQAVLERRLTRALAEQGGEAAAAGAITIETTIVDARANRLTFEQLSRNVSLDYLGSISTGGAELTAVLRSADGREISRVEHRYYQNDLRNVSLSDWGDAERAIDQFARKVARAYHQAAI